MSYVADEDVYRCFEKHNYVLSFIHCHGICVYIVFLQHYYLLDTLVISKFPEMVGGLGVGITLKGSLGRGDTAKVSDLHPV